MTAVIQTQTLQHWMERGRQVLMITASGPQLLFRLVIIYNSNTPQTCGVKYDASVSHILIIGDLTSLNFGRILDPTAAE